MLPDNAIAANVYEEIFRGLPSAIVVIGPDGTVLEANPSADSLLSCRLRGMKWLDVIRRCFCHRRDDGHEISLVNGKKVQVSTIPLLTAGGQLVQITDLTETRALQDKMRKMERLSNLGKMAASLAHQLRTPLASATLYAANLKDTRLSPAARGDFLRKLSERLRELEDQISDVLLFARSGEIVAEDTDVSALIESVAAEAEEIFDGAGAELAVAVPAGESRMMANPSAMRGALLNLCSNALDAGATRVRLQLERKDGMLEIRVADNGDGMDEKVMKSVFEPFFTTKKGGTGLGLAVVKAVVTSHQGNIRVVSAVGEGTCFIMEFPPVELGVGRNPEDGRKA